MRRSLALALSGFALALGTLTGPLAASVSDVPPARTGGFGEATCQQCHWDNPLNEPSGRLVLSGIPDTYTPGEQYPITVTLARPGLARAGFQLSAREDGINMTAGADAGTWRVVPPAVAMVHSGEKRTMYIQHTEAGSLVSLPDRATWSAEWTAPDAAGVPVVFHVSANAANNDASPLGDFIYTTVVRSR